MSLKAVHIFFISVSVLLAIGFSGWLFQQYQANGNNMFVVFSFLSLMSGISLVFYGIRFLKKLKHVSFI